MGQWENTRIQTHTQDIYGRERGGSEKKRK